MKASFLKKNKPKDDMVKEDGYFAQDEKTPEESPQKMINHIRGDDALQTSGTLGQRFIFFMLAILTPALALPVLLVFLVKSPLPLLDFTFIGLSYYKLFFCLLIVAVGLIVSSIFFFRTKMPIIAALFIGSLFCSIPLVVGMRYHLTLQQAILNISFFANWPYFLQPFFIFVSLLLPAGIIIYLILQIHNIFSRKDNSYVFVGAAAFLALALFLSSFELNRAGIPNIMDFLHSHQQPPQNVYESEPITSPDLEDLPPLPLEVYPSEAEQGTTMLPVEPEKPPISPLTEASPFSEVEQPGADFSAEAVILEEKLNGILQEIDRKIIILSQLKSAIDTQQQTDLSSIKSSIALLSQKTDILLSHIDDNGTSPAGDTGTPAIAQKAAADATKPFSFSQKNGSLKRLFEQLDSLDRKVETIQSETTNSAASKAEIIE